MSDPGRDGREPIWVGRATPARQVPLPPAVDPYWPPVEGQPPYPGGYPQQVVPVTSAPPRRPGRTALLVAAGLLAACCAGGATVTLLGSAAVRDALSPDGSDPAGLNVPVRDGRLEFVVRSFGCGHETVGRAPFVKRPQGQYCIAEVTVSNIGKDVQTFADSYQKALATDGTRYGADTGAGVFANEGTTVVFNSVNPGNQFTGKVVYDIPKDVQIVRLELHDSPLSRGVIVVLLR